METLKNKEKYYFVKKLKLNLSRNYYNLNLNELINIFPNLFELIIETYYHNNFGYESSIHQNKLIITEIEKSKINNLKFVLFGKDKITINFNCVPYNKIKSFDLYTDSIDINNIPFFINKNNVIFDCLETFHFALENCEEKLIEKEDLIENLYNNIDKMPNLIDFYFSFYCKNINEIFYKKFVKKVLSLKSIKKIFIKINYCWKNFEEEDLKQLFSNIDFNKFQKLKIYKLGDYNIKNFFI